MNILIIGNQSVLCRYLEPRLSQFADISTSGRSSGTIRIDLLSKEINIDRRFDVIIILATRTGGETIDDYIATLSTNVIGPMRVVKSAAAAGARHLILISSIFSELERTSSLYNIYGISKRHAEETFMVCCEKVGISSTIIRPSQLYDYRSLYRSHQPFFYQLIDKVSSNHPVELFGSHDPLRNFLNVEDLAEIIARVIENQIYGRFQSINPENISYVQLIETVAKVFGVKPKYKFLLEKKDIPDNVFELNTELFERIDYFPSTSLESGIKKLAKYRQRKS